MSDFRLFNLSLLLPVQGVFLFLGYEKCTVVAHDWGGMVAWSFASLHPDRVERLIVADCPHPAAFVSYLASGAFSQMKKGW